LSISRFERKQIFLSVLDLNYQIIENKRLDVAMVIELSIQEVKENILKPDIVGINLSNMEGVPDLVTFSLRGTRIITSRSTVFAQDGFLSRLVTTECCDGEAQQSAARLPRGPDRWHSV
jgi:hypothetical protein